MSDPYDRLFTARIAPCTANDRDAIRNGITITDDDGQRWKESIRTLIKPSHKPVPVLLSHDEKKPVGEIEEVFSGEGFWWADFTITPSLTLSCVAADNLRIGSAVSVGYRTLRHDESLAKAGIKWHTVAVLTELSILRHGEHPAYPGAEVRFILPHKRTPRTANTPPAAPPARAKPLQAPEPEGEVVHWPGPNTVIARRDPKNEAEMEELRRRIEWAERHAPRASFEEILTTFRWSSATRATSRATSAGRSAPADARPRTLQSRRAQRARCRLLPRMGGAT